MQIKLRINLYVIAMILLALLSVSFMGLEPMLLLCLGAVSLIALGLHKKISVNSELICLMLTFFTYFIILIAREVYVLSAYRVIKDLIGPVLGYIIGYIFTEGDEKKAKRIILIIALGQFVHGLLNLLTSLPELTASLRSVFDFWTGNRYSPTLQSVYFTAAVGVGAWLIQGQKKTYKVLGIAILAVSLLNALLTSTRTALVMVGIAVVCTILLNNKIHLWKRVFVILTVCLCAIAIYTTDTFNIKTIYEQSNMAARLSSDGGLSFTQTGRFDLAKQVLGSLWTHPFGNAALKYGHNLWIDVARLTGVIPFVFLIMYTISIIRTLVGLNKHAGIDKNTKLLFNIVYFLTLVNFCTEPILEGIFFVFVRFCIINGALRSLWFNLKHENTSYNRINEKVRSNS